MTDVDPAGSAPSDAAARYIRTILQHLGARDPVAVMQDTPRQVAALAEGLSPSQLVRAEAPGKWSMRHVVQHLADSEVVGGWRLRLVLAHDHPALQPYDQDLFAARLRYDAIDFAEALEHFAGARRANLRLWSSLSSEDLNRSGMHAERGEETLEHMRKMYAGHDLAHLAQLRRVRAAVGG